ncbi:ankyrin repeat domain-containing protein [Cardinium endosymbiont of Bemisia tabaci]|uniref:ankyrin repeat domain-containing protein n=1 Tax=Candidatus Cardinium TaxID=273135 RepID=UPI000554BCD1|nr:ankyrin repeat domain-containing protein [Cardinium endosymbiont of Bemisia tabaci]
MTTTYAQDCKGKTPLMHAIEDNKIEFAKLLIGNKTNIDLKDNSGRDALTYATTCNRKDFIDLLKNNSTNLNT